MINPDIERYPIYGLMAEFDRPEELLVAARSAYEAGYRKLDAYTPYPIEEVTEAIGFHKDRVSLVVLCCGMIGTCLGLGLASWASAIYYPLNIGGRPYLSWPSFIPIGFETTILLAAFGATFGMLIMNGLPQPYHPVFNVDRFSRASQDKFFLCIESEDPMFDPDRTGEFLKGLGPSEVTQVAY